jgi:hypothetical protein
LMGMLVGPTVPVDDPAVMVADVGFADAGSAAAVAPFLLDMIGVLVGVGKGESVGTRVEFWVDDAAASCTFVCLLGVDEDENENGVGGASVVDDDSCVSFAIAGVAGVAVTESEPVVAPDSKSTRNLRFFSVGRTNASIVCLLCLITGLAEEASCAQ